jgi:hypothetical protein
MELTGTTEQQLIFLNVYWGRMYAFTAPNGAGGPSTAQAKFGNQDELRADSATEMLLGVRRHYSASKLPRGE